MHCEIYASTSADDTIDVALHHEIKRRAYELYEQRHTADDCDDLRDELCRIAYAVSQIQKNSNGGASTECHASMNSAVNMD
jgi:hypothetical protein